MEIKTSKSAALTKFFSAVISLLFFSGVILLSIGLYSKYQKNTLSFKDYPEAISEQETQKENVLSKPARIVIEDAGINLPIEEARIKNGIWEVSDINASYLSSSAKPGGNGNIVIYGHNKKDIFGNLRTSVKLGNEIEIQSENGKTYRYRVKSVVTVSPDDVNLVLPTEYEVLTIYTCTGLFDSKRLIVSAEPVLS